MFHFSARCRLRQPKFVVMFTVCSRGRIVLFGSIMLQSWNYKFCYRYKSKFGFPFIICARENKVQSIINGLQQRYNSTREQEIATGINEVKKICKLRITDIVKDDWFVKICQLNKVPLFHLFFLFYVAQSKQFEVI